MVEQITDEINFHEFLHTMREVQDKTLGQLGKGLYSVAMISKIEKGERFPKKLERDRLVARLGVSGEGYEDYLSREEYAEWCLRQQLLGSIKEKKLRRTANLLMKYEQQPKMSKVSKQFLEAMRFMYLTLRGASPEELRPVIELAVSYTIPGVKARFPRTLLLSEQEINLLIEYVSLARHHDKDSKHKDWQLRRYDYIERYIQQSCIDEIGKAKVYPKLVYYICKTYLTGRMSKRALRECLEMCEEAITSLRKAKRMYYLVELLEIQKTLNEKALATEDFSGEKFDSREYIERNDEWLNMLVALYRKYDISPYMEDFVHLYIETESYNTNDVIRSRRKMYGLTQEKLAGDTCSIRTIQRAEGNEMTIQMYCLRGVFEKLGLCPEYIRADVIARDAEAMRVYHDVARYGNYKSVDKWKAALNKLESMLCMDILYNQQTIERSKVLIAECKKMISKEEAVERLKEILEMTVPLNGLFEAQDWYLTVEEITCLYNIAIRIDKSEPNEFLRFLRRYCHKIFSENRMYARMDVHSLVVTGVANYLGNIGEYVESIELNEKMIRSDLLNRRMFSLHKNLYSSCWNRYCDKNTNRFPEKHKEVHDTLVACTHLSTIIGDDILRNFFSNKLVD